MLSIIFLVLTATPDQLIEELGGPDYRFRQEASRQLEQLGEAARPALLAAQKDARPEIRLRSKTLLTALDCARLSEPSKVKLSMTGKTSDIFAEITKQTGNPIITETAYGHIKDDPVSLNVDGTYWEAVDALCSASGNRVWGILDISLAPHTVVLESKLDTAPVAYGGPVRARITSIKRSFSEETDFFSVNLTHSMVFYVMFEWEPKCEIVTCMDRPVVTARHGTTSYRGQPNAGWSTVARRHTASFQLVPIVSAGHKRLDELTMEWDVLIVGGRQCVQVYDLNDVSQISREDLDMWVKSEKKDKSNQVRVTILRDAVPVFPGVGGYSDLEGYKSEFKVEVVGENGPLWSNVNRSVDDAGLHIDFNFTDDPENAFQYFSISYPMIRARKTLSFKFTDVPIPSTTIK